MDSMEVYQIIFIIVVNIMDIRCKTTMGCNVTRGNLTCSNDKMIHVQRISFWLYSGADCNKTRRSCGKNTTFLPTCNGKTSCIEKRHPPSDCNGTTSTVFKYKCIDRDTSLVDMCTSIEGDAGNRFFLTSPSYPRLSNNIQKECRCSIRGTNITSITVLDLRLVSAMDGTMSSLYIQYGDKTETITSRNKSKTSRVTSKTLYNYKVQLPSTTTATTANINFNHNQVNRLKLWLEIEGIALHVSCNNNATSTSVSTPLANVTSSSLSPTQSTSTLQSSSISTASTILPSSTSTNSLSPTMLTHTPTDIIDVVSTNLQLTSTVSLYSSLDDSTTLPSSTVTGSTTVQTSTHSSPLPTSATDNLIGIIAGTVVSGIIIIIIIIVVVILCFKIQRKRTADPPRHVDVHVNVASNNYFVLEVPKDRESFPLDAKVDLDYQESHLNNIKSDSSTNPRYSIVETGKTKNQHLSKLYKYDQKNKPVLNIKPVEDVEILQNDLYVPFQPSLVNKFPECKEPDQEKHNPPSDHENIKINQPSDVEIMENDLYVSYDNSTFNQPSDIKVSQPSDAKVSQPLDIKINPQSDIEIMANDLYVSYDNSTANQPSDVNVSQPSDIKVSQPPEIEIMENDLYVPFEKSK